MSSNSPLISATWLAQHLDDASLVLVDCRFALANPDLGQRQYATSHIPNAWYLDLNRDLSSPVQAHGGRHPLPDPATLAQRLSAMGVRSGPEPTLVVAYDDSRFAFAARLWWLLRYLGHDRVAVLDGGWGGWVAAGYPTSAALPVAQSGHFVPSPQPGWTVDYLGVKERPAGTVLIDSRSPERYRGEVEPIDPVAGSIPGAINCFWQQVSTADGSMQPPAALAKHWARLDTPQAIVYCGSGVTACVNLLAQAVAGLPLSRLYPGGWSDWCSYLTADAQPEPQCSAKPEVL